MDEQLSNLLRKISKYIFIGVAVLLVLLLLLSLLRVSIGFWLWSTVETWAIVRLGLGSDAAQLVTVILVSLITLLMPTLAWYFLWGKKQLWATGAVVGGQILIFLLVSTIGSGVCFDRQTGKPLCWYADIPGKGRVFSRSDDYDPEIGIKYQLYTREVALASSTSINQTNTQQPNTRTSSNERSIVVRGTDRWLDTGISVQKGDRITISAGGSIYWSPPGRNMKGTVSPDGTRPPFPEDSGAFPMPEAGCASLVMRIGKSKYAVGSAAIVDAKEAGTIQLMVNDDDLSDNSGSFTVTIKL